MREGIVSRRGDWARRLGLVALTVVGSLTISSGLGEAAPRARQVIVSGEFADQLVTRGMSGDGRFVIYQYPAAGQSVLRLVDNETGTDTIISGASDFFVSAVISPGGETVAYMEPGLVFYDTATGERDEFDQFGTNSGEPKILGLVDEGNVAVVTDDGRPSEGFILFDRRTGEPETLPVPSGLCDATDEACLSRILERAMSSNGRFFVFEEERYCAAEDPEPGCEPARGLFVFDRTGSTLVPLEFDENEAGSFTMDISDDGETVRWRCLLVDVATGDTTPFSILPDGTETPTCSQVRMTPDARYVAFTPSEATGPTGGGNGTERSIFVRDMELAETRLATLPEGDTILNDQAYNPYISDDGQRITFASAATNLIGDDKDQHSDVFVTTWFQYSLVAPGVAHQVP